MCRFWDLCGLLLLHRFFVRSYFIHRWNIFSNGGNIVDSRRNTVDNRRNIANSRRADIIIEFTRVNEQQTPGMTMSCISSRGRIVGGAFGYVL